VEIGALNLPTANVILSILKKTAHITLIWLYLICMSTISPNRG